MQDNFNQIKVVRAISPTRATDNTALVSQIIDRSGFESLVFAIAIGTLADADATFAVTIDHGAAANLSDAASVAAADLHGTTTLAGFQFDDDNEIRKLGYAGVKRYVRLTITPSANSGNADIACLAILGHPRTLPQSTQAT